FLSLSGFSGVLAGVYALIGAYFGNNAINEYLEMEHRGAFTPEYQKLVKECVIICVLVLIMSLLTALIFSKRKAKKNETVLFDHTTWRLMINMLIPLSAGGLFCLALVIHGHNMLGLVGPSMLIFYGLALVNGSKYTLHDIRYLGCMEIALGLAASFFIGYGLIFWTLGFGVLHILYGAYMWFKYDRN